jgi:endonuclease/exonuclease/phosphatase family metal-dependent hydrolase
LRCIVVCVWMTATTLAASIAAAAIPDETAMLRLMSFNLRNAGADDGDNSWPHRREAVMQVIAAFDPDVLGVQECLPLQADFLRHRMPDHEFVGVGRDDGGQAGEIAGLLLRRDRFELLTQRHLWLSDTPDTPGSRGWDAALPRTATIVTLADRRTQRRLVVINTHLDHRGEIARAESARLLVASLDPELPTVLMGDFNCRPDSEPYRILVGNGAAAGGDGPLRDTHRLAGHDETEAATFHRFTLRTRGPRIDFILTTPHWSVSAAAIVRTAPDGRPPSDHFPITAVVTLDP